MSLLSLLVGRQLKAMVKPALRRLAHASTAGDVFADEHDVIEVIPSLARAGPAIPEEERDVPDSVMDWLNNADISELQEGAIIRAAPWNPAPLHMPLTSIITRNPGDICPRRRVVTLDPTVFSHPIRRDILHLCVQYYRDSLRQGTASTKNRAEVSGSGKKLRPQKGTGKARLGDRGSPMLKGGGRAFGPKPRDFSTLLPRKVLDMGMRVALSAKIRDSSLGVVETLQWPGIKTGEFKRKIGSLGWKKVLFIAGASQVPENLLRSSRNLQEVYCMVASEVTVYDLLSWRSLVMDVEALEWFEKRYSKLETTRGATAESIAGHADQSIVTPSVLSGPKPTLSEPNVI